MSIILLVLQLLPSIIQTIIAIEQAFKGIPAAGPAKKQVIMDALATATPDAKTTEIVSRMIDNTVTSLNKTGILSSNTPPSS